MAQLIIMPQKSMTLPSNLLTEWYKEVGDKVNEGDALFSYETEKSSFDELATVSGVLLAKLYNEYDDVPVLTGVCIIGEEGEDISSMLENAGGQQLTPSDNDEKSSLNQETEKLNEDEEDEINSISADSEINISKRAKKTAERLKIDYRKAKPTGPNNRIIEEDILKLIGTDARYTSAAYNQMNEAIVHTGLNNRTRMEDYNAKAPIQVKEISKEVTIADYDVVKMSSMRKAISKNMMNSLQNSAQLTHMISFDATAIMNFRKFVKEKTDYKITLNDIVSYALIKVLKNHKDLNSLYVNEEIRRYNTVNLGVAVDIEGGLVVPTIFGSDKLSLVELSKQIKEKASLARESKLSPNDLSGATITISNVGSTGVTFFTPVLNPPQVALLGVGAMEPKLRMKSESDYEVYQSMALSLTFDHRIIDGAPAARFLKDLCNFLEDFANNVALL